MRESKVEAHLHTQVEKHGGTTRKFKSPGRNNVPDRIVIWPGAWVTMRQVSRHAAEVHFVECKRPGKDANEAQAREHVRLLKLGCVVMVLDTLEKVDNYIGQRTCDSTRARTTS